MMAKLNVTAVVEWGLTSPYVVVSVESPTGQGVKGLPKSSFVVGTIGGGGGWNQAKVTGLDPIGGIGEGFYYLALDPGQPYLSWGIGDCNLVFTVEVHDKKRGDQGQAIATNVTPGTIAYGMQTWS